MIANLGTDIACKSFTSVLLAPWRLNAQRVMTVTYKFAFRKIVLSTIATICIIGLTSVASATPVYTTVLTDQSGSSRGTGPWATVQLVQNTSLEGYSAVDVTVTPTNTATTGFVNTGIHHSFAFNIEAAITILNLTNGFTAGTTFNNPPWGTFGYTLDCTGCGNGATNPWKAPLTFTIRASTAAAISPDSFSANALGSFFAADLSVNGNTGAAGTSTRPTITGNIGAQTAVPEPASMTLLAGGVLGLAMRRRRSKA
jgi:hypothetical protein